MQRNGIVALVSVALLTVAVLVAAYFFTHRPQPESVDRYEHVHAAEIALVAPHG